MSERITIDRVSRNDDLHAYVKAGRPVVVVDEVTSWRSFARWTLPYLRSAFETRQEFALLGRQALSFSEFADKLETDQPNVWAPQLSVTGRPDHGGLKRTAHELLPDLDYPTLLDRGQLDEVNVWIGRGHTPLHFDGYDNLLAVVRGTKSLLLLEPTWYQELYIERFKWSAVDIKRRDLERFPRLAMVPDALELVLQEGEMLYLPAYWLHQVDVASRYAISLNYWYRCQQGVEASGCEPSFYAALLTMLRAFGDLNRVEKTLAMHCTRAVLDQLAEGRGPNWQEQKAWSGVEDVRPVRGSQSANTGHSAADVRR